MGQGIQQGQTGPQSEKKMTKLLKLRKRVKETTTCLLLISSNSLLPQGFYTRGWEGGWEVYQGQTGSQNREKWQNHRDLGNMAKQVNCRVKVRTTCFLMITSNFLYPQEVVQGAGLMRQTGLQKCEKWQKLLELRENSKSSEFQSERNNLFFVDHLLISRSQEVLQGAGKRVGRSTRDKQGFNSVKNGKNYYN